MKSLLLSMLFLLTTVTGHAKEGGNGGGVHKCWNSIELYDFYEGRSSRGHDIKVWKEDSTTSFETYLEKALAHVKKDIPDVHGLVSDMVKKILEIPQDKLFVNVYIPEIEDANISVLGIGCSYEQIANWNERFNSLFISKNLYDRLGNMNRAGLIVHEAIYKLSRMTMVANHNSDAVREVVARIFSDEVLTKKDAEVINSEHAKIMSTKPMCDEIKKNFELVSAEDPSMTKEIATICLRYCLIPEERVLCQKKLE